MVPSPAPRRVASFAGFMHSHGSDSSDEPVRYTRRTARRPGPSRRVSLERESSDQSPERQRLRACQTQGMVDRSRSAELLQAAAAAVGGLVSIDSAQLWSGVPGPNNTPTALQTAGHSLRAQERDHRNPTAGPIAKVLRISSQSSEGEDRPLTFSRSVARPQPRGRRAAFACSESSSDSGCETFRRSVPRHSRRPVLSDSSGTDSPPARQMRRHAPREPQPSDIPSDVPTQHTANAAGMMPFPALSGSSRRSADDAEASTAHVGGQLPGQVGSSSSGGGSPSAADSVAAELERLMLGSGAGAAKAPQSLNASAAERSQGDMAHNIALAHVQSGDALCTTRWASAPSSIADKHMHVLSGGKVSVAPSAQTPQAGAVGKATVTLESDIEPDSSPQIGTARRSICRARRAVLADSDSEASPNPAQAQASAGGATASEQRQLLQASPASSDARCPALDPSPLGFRSPIASKKATPPPEWMTSARRSARPPADSPLGVLCNPAPRAVSFETPVVTRPTAVAEARVEAEPPSPAGHRWQQTAPAHGVEETSPTPDRSSWLERGLDRWEPGVCGQATPLQGLETAVLPEVGEHCPCAVSQVSSATHERLSLPPLQPLAPPCTESPSLHTSSDAVYVLTLRSQVWMLCRRRHQGPSQQSSGRTAARRWL